MWHTRNRLCTISFTAQEIAFCIFSTTTSRPITICAHETHALENNEIVDLRLFHFTRIKQIITNFAKKHALKNTPVLFGLHGPGLLEQRIISADNAPKHKSCELAGKKNYVWDQCYVHPTHDGNFAFYACALPQSLLFQYKLLAIACGLNVTHITTHRLALLHAYKHVHHAAFRPAQLGVHLTEKHNKIEEIMDCEIVWRIIKTAHNAHLPEQINPKLLLVHCGLFTIGHST